MARREVVSVQLIGGPTAVVDYGGLRFMTDPTFDPPGSYEVRPGVSMTKYAGPAAEVNQLPSIDAVLLSHDHHVDNLDRSGRDYLPRVPLTLTTRAGAARLGGHARGLAPWESYELQRPNGEPVLVTAVPAQHGPDGTDHLTGEVTGFYVSSQGLPTVYVSGDNASVAIARRIVGTLGSASIALLHAGAAQMPHLGDNSLTLSAARAPKVARLIGAKWVIPVHFDGWAHFSEGVSELQDAFARVGLGDRLRVLESGETVDVELASPLKIAVVGASGSVGRAITREALARGHDLIAISRHPRPERSAPGSRAVALDANSPELAEALKGVDVVIGAVSGRRDDRPEQIPQLAQRLLEASAEAGVQRLLWVGGAGSLEVIPGLRGVDTPTFPPELRPEALAQGEALEVFRTAIGGVVWSYFSPAAFLDAHGDGGDPYHLDATDSLLRDEDGASRIALLDYARAAIDEIECPRFDMTRFTIAAQTTAHEATEEPAAAA